MQLRNVGQWLCILAIGWTSGSAVVSCGGAGQSSVFVDGGQDSSLGDGSNGNNDSSLLGDDGGGSDSGACGTCQSLGYNCGMDTDKCHNPINCGTCPMGQACGNGGFNKCGSTIVGGDGGDAGSNCTPATTCPTGQNCGYESDGCGGVVDCAGAAAGDAGACTAPEFCGGGGFNVCGGNDDLTQDGAPMCTPKTTCSAGMNCGQQGDGCGGVVTCGSGMPCAAPEFCGGGGPNVCGGNSGLAPDGGAICNPETCLSQGFNCGFAGNGCGGVLQCGSCTGNDICGGGGVPGQCGNSTCTNLCKQQPTCAGGVTTTITGTVIAGTIAMFGTPDPVPNVLVYVPNAPLQPFTTGVQCSQCGAEVSGSPLVETTTAFNGTFTLTNVPAGTNIPVVIQLGRWRRIFTFNVPSCATTAIGSLQMPQNQGQGDIPFTAISTGSVDTIECVLLKMGVAQTEFVPQCNPAGAGFCGRINMYIGNGVTAGAGTTQEAALIDTGGSYMNYDQILFPCWGAEVIKDATSLADLVTYGNGGGHFFATHYSYTWLFTNNPYNTTANWDVNYNSENGPINGTVWAPPATPPAGPINPEGTIFTDWLELVGAMPNPPNVSISYPRHDVDTVAGQSVDWISTTDPTGTNAANDQWLLHYTFDTPVGATTQCGHSIFSDFHVTNAAVTDTTTFPAECMKNETTGKTCTNAAPCPMTAQEKILEYMIWDLASCVPGPPTPPTCTPTTCQAQNITCGPAGDGCGNELMCGTCTPPQTCGGGGVPGQCGAPDGGNCTAQTCQQQNIDCGPAGDGCGNLIQCGPCSPPQTCGGGGIPGQCGYPEAGTCAPETCSQQMIFCGPAGDGCGNEIQCGTCTPPMTCGGGGQPGVCGEQDAATCMPQSCAAQMIQCGSASDGCGNMLQCPACPTGQTCINGMCEQSSQ
jgi:hypothetical protein